MIRLDCDGEDFVFNNDWDLAVPIVVRKSDGGQMYIEVYPSYEDAAREFESLFQDDPFSDGALRFIWDRIGRDMETRGYNDEKKFRDRFYYNYVIKDPSQIKRDVILPQTVRLTEDSSRGLKNRTTFEIEAYIEEDIPAYIKIEGGEIVAISAKNVSCSGDFDADPDCVCANEISVETAVGFRGRGYGASCAAALSAELSSNAGSYVLYESDMKNTASQRVAEKVGFFRYGRCYYYVLRRR